METLLTHLWKSAVLITIFYGFYQLFLQKETYFNSIRYFLISGVLLSICIPFITPITYIEIAPIQTYAVDSADTATILNPTTSNWSLIILTIYSGVALFLFIRFLMQLTATIRLISRHQTMKEGKYKFIETDSLSSPFSFFTYIVYNPTQFEKDELTQILAHEKAHVLQLHSIDNLLSNFLAIVLWFNPFVWLYKRTIEQNLEFIADEHAQKLTKSQQTYQQLLLKTTVPNYQMAMTNNFYNSLLKKRIIMLHKRRSNNKTQWKYALIVPLLLAFIFTLNTKTIAQQKENKTSEQTTNWNTSARVIINKNTTEADFKAIKGTFKNSFNVDFTYTVSRNSENEINRIETKLKDEFGEVTWNDKKNRPIKSFQLTYDPKSKVKTATTVVENNIDKREKQNEIIFNSGNKDERPLIILDGKEITSKEMEALDSDSIKSIDVIKGTKAIEKYGKKGKNGVIVITSK